MTIRRIFRILCGLFFAAQFTTVSSWAAMPENPVDRSRVINGHRFVDLGLPSGLLWAETNVGAETVAADGDWFAWGETSEKFYYSWDTYMHGTSSDRLDKYNATDGLRTLEADDDAATANWGRPCRMPTRKEFNELVGCGVCKWKWTAVVDSATREVVKGYLVTSKKTGNSVFFPAAGSRYFDCANSRATSGNYWSSSLIDKERELAYCFEFSKTNYDGWSFCKRYSGRSVRAVAKPL